MLWIKTERVHPNFSIEFFKNLKTARARIIVYINHFSKKIFKYRNIFLFYNIIFLHIHIKVIVIFCLEDISNLTKLFNSNITRYLIKIYIINNIIGKY